jgi:pimeloyl-ACP methyl ester carboxylesterase
MKGRKRLWFVYITLALLLAAGVGFWAHPVSYFNGMMYLRAYLTGVESRTVTVNGYRIHYNVDGPEDGLTVVLVHGLGGRAEDWRELAPWLAKAGYRVYMPDLIGYGRSERPANFSYSVPGEAGLVVGFLDALGLKQVDLGGWSMGGWIVQVIANEHPERVRRLMLFDSAGLFEKPKWDTRLFTPQTPAELDQLDALLMPDPPRIPGFIARDILRVSRQNAWVVRRALATMLTGGDATDSLLPKLKVPVLIEWGAEDHITPLSQGEKMHRLVPQSEFVVVPGCGHLAPVDCSRQMGPKMLEFVRRRVCAITNAAGTGALPQPESQLK